MTRRQLAALVGLLILFAAAGAYSVRKAILGPPEVTPIPASVPAPAAASSQAAGAFPPPSLDLSPDRFYERVDGAESVLRSLGCRRMMVWRLDNPPADLEVLAFGTADGAARALARDAGPDRTPGVPGDEGWANGQVVYFRWGTVLVRLITDAPGDPTALLTEARRVDDALTNREIRP